jgi:hypothetical protein
MTLSRSAAVPEARRERTERENRPFLVACPSKCLRRAELDQWQVRGHLLRQGEQVSIIEGVEGIRVSFRRRRPETEKHSPPRHRKRGPTGGAGPRQPTLRAQGKDESSGPSGVMWPTGGFEADQYSPAGEVAAFGKLFQGIQRRLRRR